MVYDIETAPLDMELLKEMIPDFEAPGNLTDPQKIIAAINKKMAAWFEKAALSAETGRVLAIGMLKSDQYAIVDCDTDEKGGVEQFWYQITDQGAFDQNIIGFNTHGFDLPFLIRRSWKLGVAVPRTLRKGRYWNERSIDLMDVWSCGNREDSISLDRLAKYLGVGHKTGSGKDFAELWKSNREAAHQYLRNDLELTKKIAERLGVTC